MIFNKNRVLRTKPLAVTQLLRQRKQFLEVCLALLLCVRGLAHLAIDGVDGVPGHFLAVGAFP